MRRHSIRFAHTIERARHRYGVELTPADVSAMQAAIEYGHPIAVRVGQNHDGSLIYAYRFEGQWIGLTFKRGAVVTALPREVLWSRPDYRATLKAAKRALRAAGLEAPPTHHPDPPRRRNA